MVSVTPQFDQYKLPLAKVEQIATGYRWCEGPVWFGDQRVLSGVMYLVTHNTAGTKSPVLPVSLKVHLITATALRVTDKGVC